MAKLQERLKSVSNREWIIIAVAAAAMVFSIASVVLATRGNDTYNSSGYTAISDSNRPPYYQSQDTQTPQGEYQNYDSSQPHTGGGSISSSPSDGSGAPTSGGGGQGGSSQNNSTPTEQPARADFNLNERLFIAYFEVILTDKSNCRAPHLINLGLPNVSHASACDRNNLINSSAVRRRTFVRVGEEYTSNVRRLREEQLKSFFIRPCSEWRYGCDWAQQVRPPCTTYDCLGMFYPDRYIVEIVRVNAKWLPNRFYQNHFILNEIFCREFNLSCGRW